MPAERLGHRGDAVLAAFDLDEDADRRFVDRDDDVLVRELLAVLLVAEPDVQAELLEHAQQHLAVADDGLELLAHFHDARLHRPLEGEPALAVLHPHAQHAAPPAQRLVVGVEERVLLQPAPEQRRRAAREDRRARLVRRREPQLDFTLDRSWSACDVRSRRAGLYRH